MQDDAGGGRRGLRAAPSAGLIAAVQAAYGLGDAVAVGDLGGSANLNLRARDLRTGREYVVRVYRPHVTASRVDAIHLARDTLATAGLPVPVAERTLDGRRRIAWGGRQVELEPFVDWRAAGAAPMKSGQALRTGLRTLARVHAALAGLSPSVAEARPRFGNVVDAREAVPGTARGAARLRGLAPGDALVRLADDAEDLAQRVAALEAACGGGRPAQQVHGDYWDHNVFVAGASVVLVTDLDFMGVRPRIDDLGLTLYFACMEPRGPSPADGVGALVDAYDAGSTDPLSPAERAALPLAMARQPLWSFAVWVAELDDDVVALRHAEGSAPAVRWARALLRDLEAWRRAVACR